MQPIFGDMLKMWADMGYDLPMKEGRFWLENNFIQGFTPDGEMHKLYKYKVNSDLSIEITPYRTNKSVIYFVEEDAENYETWQQTADRLQAHLDSLTAESLSVIQDTVNNYSDYEFVAFTSTGKDSMVMLDLVQKVLPDVRVVFNNTSLDCAETYRMVKAHGWEISNPPIGFYQHIKKYNYIPNRISRGCCSVFKEGNSIEYLKDSEKLIQFMGVRNDESNKRADREFISKNPKWKDKDWLSCLPIRKWSELDIWLYTIKNNLEINPKYKKGYKRLGCAISCRYATKFQWSLDKYWYPKARERWERILDKDFIQNLRWTKMNCTRAEYIQDGWNGTLYRPEPTEEVIQEFMHYKGITDKNLALQYFNKICCECGKNVRQSDVLAMNLKLIGRETEQIYCKKCLRKKFNISMQEWDESVQRFKDEGCELF